MIRVIGTAVGTLLAVALAAGCHSDSNTMTGPGTTTPVPTAGVNPTPTPSSSQNATVNVGQSGGNVFRDQRSGTSTTTIRAGGTVNWAWVSGFHSATSGSCPGGGCSPDGRWDSGVRSGGSFSHTFSQAGSFPYYCTVHGAMMQGMVVVQ